MDDQLYIVVDKQYYTTYNIVERVINLSFGIGSTLLDACVLSILSRGDTYGYILTQNVRTIMDISESTLYPVLRRLQKNGYLTTYDQPYQGRNRRYYHITEDGQKQYEMFKKEWFLYQEKVNALLLGGNEDE